MNDSRLTLRQWRMSVQYRVSDVVQSRFAYAQCATTITVGLGPFHFAREDVPSTWLCLELVHIVGWF